MSVAKFLVDEIDPSIYIYGEGWSAGSCAYPTEKLAVKANTPQLHGIGAFSDDMRDALRGPFSDDTKGALLAGISGEEESLKFGIIWQCCSLNLRCRRITTTNDHHIVKS